MWVESVSILIHDAYMLHPYINLQDVCIFHGVHNAIFNAVQMLSFSLTILGERIASAVLKFGALSITFKTVLCIYIYPHPSGNNNLERRSVYHVETLLPRSAALHRHFA